MHVLRMVFFFYSIVLKMCKHTMGYLTRKKKIKFVISRFHFAHLSKMFALHALLVVQERCFLLIENWFFGWGYEVQLY